MMNKISPNYRTDVQLEAIIAETGDWVVNGRGGCVLCAAPSLQCAVARAVAYQEAREVVLAVSRLPDDNIIVFSGQIERLARHLKGSDMLLASR
jgi:hypothetical protein